MIDMLEDRLDEFLRPTLPPWMYHQHGLVCMGSPLDAQSRSATTLRPWKYVLGCVLSFSCCAMAIRWHSLHMNELSSGSRPSGRRGLYMLIAKLGPVAAFTSTVGTAIPVLHKSLELLLHIFISVVMWAFLELLFLMTVQESKNSNAMGEGSQDMQERSSARNVWEQTDLDLAVLLDPEDYFVAVRASLQSQPPLRLWAAPPLGCCFHLPCFRSTPCGRSALPDVQLLAFTRRVLVMYMTLMPSVPLVRMVLYVSTGGRHLVAIVLNLAEGLLSILALYALFICYRVTHHILHDYCTTRKFVAIKAIILLLQPQRLLVQSLVGDGTTEFWLSCLQSLEAPILCWFLATSYPRHELASRAASRSQGERDVQPLV